MMLHTKSIHPHIQQDLPMGSQIFYIDYIIQIVVLIQTLSGIVSRQHLACHDGYVKRPLNSVTLLAIFSSN